MAEDLCIGSLFAGFFVFGFGGLVFEVSGHECSADTFLGEGEDVERAGEGFGARDHGVADAHFGGGLGDGSVEADGGASASLGGIAACFIGTDCPEPFVYACVLHEE